MRGVVSLVIFNGLFEKSEQTTPKTQVRSFVWYMWETIPLLSWIRDCTVLGNRKEICSLVSVLFHSSLLFPAVEKNEKIRRSLRRNIFSKPFITIFATNLLNYCR